MRNPRKTLTIISNNNNNNDRNDDTGDGPQRYDRMSCIPQISRSSCGAAP